MEGGFDSEGEDPLLLRPAGRVSREARPPLDTGPEWTAAHKQEDVVPTSDDEEREEELARLPAYWAKWRAETPPVQAGVRQSTLDAVQGDEAHMSGAPGIIERADERAELGRTGAAVSSADGLLSASSPLLDESSRGAAINAIDEKAHLPAFSAVPATPTPATELNSQHAPLDIASIEVEAGRMQDIAEQDFVPSLVSADTVPAPGAWSREAEHHPSPSILFPLASLSSHAPLSNTHGNSPSPAPAVSAPVLELVAEDSAASVLSEDEYQDMLLDPPTPPPTAVQFGQVQDRLQDEAHPGLSLRSDGAAQKAAPQAGQQDGELDPELEEEDAEARGSEAEDMVLDPPTQARPDGVYAKLNSARDGSPREIEPSSAIEQQVEPARLADDEDSGYQDMDIDPPTQAVASGIIKQGEQSPASPRLAGSALFSPVEDLIGHGDLHVDLSAQREPTPERQVSPASQSSTGAPIPHQRPSNSPEPAEREASPERQPSPDMARYSPMPIEAMFDGDADFLLDDPEVPPSVAAGQADIEVHTEHQGVEEINGSPTHSPSVRRARARTSSTSSLSSAGERPADRPTSLAPRPEPQPARPRSPTPPIAIDPELQAFQRGRTFRTRTLMQLQPYTREKMRYTRLIKQGGRRLVEELLTYDPVPEPVAEDNEDESQFRASVAEESPNDPEIDMAVSPPVAPADEDYDAYFGLYGTVADGDDDPRLQELARTRLREEELEKRKRAKADRIARRIEREVEAELRERARAERQKKKREAEERRAAREAERAAAAAASRGAGNDEDSDDESGMRGGSSATHSTTPLNRPKAKRKRKTPRQASNGLDDTDMQLDVHDPWVDHGDMLEPDRTSATSPRSPITPAESASSLRQRSPSSRRGSARTATHRNPVIISSDSSGDSDSLAPPVLPREKSKALKRVMPAFMAKRLEKVAEQKYQEKRRRPLEERGANSERPGQARTRKRGRSASDDGIADFFVADDAVEAAAEPFNYAAVNFEDPPFPDLLPADFDFGDDTVMRMTPSSSSASEDDERLSDNESIRDLVAGDFEQVLRGPKPRQRSAAPRTSRGNGHARSRLGNDAPPANKRLRQMRLELPASKRRVNASDKAPTKRSAGHRIRRNKAPLDDASIFEANAGVAPFQHEARLPLFAVRREEPRDTTRAPRPGPVPLASPTTTSASPPPQIDPEDRQDLRVWNTLGEFQIDFDLSPLPSGVVCEAPDYPSWPSLWRFSRGISATVPMNTEAYGVHLLQGTTQEDMIALVPLLLDSMLRHLHNSTNPTEDSLGRLDGFLMPFLEGLKGDADPALLDSWRNAAADLLSEVRLLQVTRHAGQAEQSRTVLRYSWWLYTASLALRKVADKQTIPIDGLNLALQQLCKDTASNMVRKLLDHGLHRSMQQLKPIISGQASDNHFEDLSVRLWICLINSLPGAGGGRTIEVEGSETSESLSLHSCFSAVAAELYGSASGPLASEKVWYLVFGLAVLRQFDDAGRTATTLNATPDWPLVVKALEMTKVKAMDDVTESHMRYELKMRDRYVKVMVVRCLKLATTWQWTCSLEELANLLKSLGLVFKERSHRSLPNESSGDFPSFINGYDLSLTEQYDLGDTAYNLYLKLICLLASDVISTATSVDQAKSITQGFQRGMMAIFPFSSVPFTRDKPPTNRQTAMLINRYSTLIVLTLFVPDLADWLLVNASRWLAYDRADLASRNIIVRGLMYFAVACRHHKVSVEAVVNLFAAFFATLVQEMSAIPPGIGASDLKRIENQRSQVLIISCFRHIIGHHSFSPEQQKVPRYPDVKLLNNSWIDRLTSPDLVTDRRSGNEIVACVQSFLDERAKALPLAVQRARTARREEDSQDSEFDSFGMDWTAVDLLNVGMGTETVVAPVDPDLAADKAFAEIVRQRISPAMYSLLSNIFSGDVTVVLDSQDRADRQIYISRLTKCWADCASVVVVDHGLRDWSTYTGHGAESWNRLSDDHGRRQVGMNFMLNVARLDSNAFSTHAEDFIALLYQTLITDSITIEHQYLAAVCSMPGVRDHVLLRDALPTNTTDLDRSGFLQQRMTTLRGLFGNIPSTLQSSDVPSLVKSLVYASVTKMLSAMEVNYNLISASKWEQRRKYAAFCDEVVGALRELAGQRITPVVVPKLKAFPLEAPTAIPPNASTWQ